MDVGHEESGSKGTFYIDRDGVRAGWMTYSRAGATTIIVDQTEVTPALRGTGAGKRMLEEVVAWARRDGLKIIPLCPFVASVFAKDASIADVLST